MAPVPAKPIRTTGARPARTDGDRVQELTFVFTDIEGSTRLLEKLRERYGDVLARHGELIREAASRTGGEVVDTQGDAFFLAFRSPAQAVAFASDAQRALERERWPGEGRLRVRMGVHAGEAARTATGYVGLDVHRAARISSAGHGGQVLVSGEAAEMLGHGDGIGLRSLGQHQLKDFARPVLLHQLLIDGLQSDFPPPRVVEEPDQPPAEGEPPFQGLAHFDEADAERFFGREKVVERLAGRLAKQPFLAVIGASGSGKSSVVRAGLVPALRAKGVSNVVVLTPTAEPFSALAAALAPDGGANLRDELTQLLRFGPDALAERLGPDSLLVVDQVEELFSLCRDEGERAAFIERLLSATGAGGRVVLTLRADFYDRLAGYPALRDAVAAHQEYLGQMSSDELRRAIEGPAEAGGWRFDAGLVDLILHDVGSEPGALPLLSHALLETWQRRRGRLMMLRGYLESGGVQGAIARSADRLMAELEPDQQDIARAIFLRLTEFGAGTPDTRRRAALEELLGQSNSEQASVVLQRLAEHRLVVLGDDTAEVAHEALIREWPTLREWLASDREALRLHRRLTEAATEWQRSGQDPSLLFRGARLAAALDWATEHDAELNASEREFLEASRLASEHEARRQRQVNRRLRFLLAGAGVFLVLAIAAGAYATLEAGRAEQGELLAQSRELAASAIAVSESDPQLAILLALEAVRSGGTPAPEAVSALHTSVQSSRAITRVEGPDQPVRPRTVGVALSADGEHLYVSTDSTSVREYDVESGELLRTFGTPSEDTEGHRLFIATTENGPNGPRIALTDENAVVHVWDIADGREIQLQAPGFGADWPAISPDGRLVAALTWTTPTPDGDPIVSLFEIDSGRMVHRWDYEFMRSLQFHPNGQQLLGTACVCSVESALVIMDMQTGDHELIGDRLPELEATGPQGADFSPDGVHMATVGADGMINIWDVATGANLRQFAGHTERGTSIVYSPDGERIATTGDDGTSRVWDVATGQELLHLAGQGGSPHMASFSGDGRRLATASDDMSTWIWDLSAARPAEVRGFALGEDFVQIRDMDHSGDVAAILGRPCRATFCMGHAAFLNLGSGEVTVIPNQMGAGIGLAPDLGGLYSQLGYPEPGLPVGPLQHYPLWSTEPALEMQGLCPKTLLNPVTCGVPPDVPFDEQVWAFGFSPDSSLMAMVGQSQALTVWNRNDGSLIHVTNAGEYIPEAPAFSRRGEWLAVSTFGGLRILDATTLEMFVELAVPAGIQLFSPTNESLAIGGGPETLLVSTSDWSTKFTLPVASRALDFSSDGTRLVTYGSDNVIRLWDTDTGRELHAAPVPRTGPGRVIPSISFLDDERHVLIPASGALIVLTVDMDELIDIANSRLVRSLTDAECQKYLHLNTCPAQD
jgi:WD40 repeat protein/class 3 adenylate cyclase